MKREIGDRLFKTAEKYLVAGVSSAIRWNYHQNRPLYFRKGTGSYLMDYDGNKFIDMCCSHGASIMGHGHPEVIKGIKNGLEMGIMCSYETEYQAKLAKMICGMIPCAELCRYTCSGTEATMNAIRLAREYTGKEVILKFEGHFHGYHDYVQYSFDPGPEKAGPYNNPTAVPFSAGMPKELEKYIKVIPFNNEEILVKAVNNNKDKLAAIILEPINYNFGGIIPDKRYMSVMQKIAKDNNIILIFDEVLSAFRTGPDCAQGYIGITPDLCVIGKSVAGGNPLSVIAGKKEIMEHMTPFGKSVHSGTYNGHLLPVMAGIASMSEIRKPYFYKHIFKLADKLYKGFDDIFKNSILNIKIQGLGARFGLYFNVKKEIIREYRDCMDNDGDMSLRFYELMYKKGVYLHGKHNGFSIQHSIEDIDEILNKTEDTIKEMEKIY